MQQLESFQVFGEVGETDGVGDEDTETDEGVDEGGENDKRVGGDVELFENCA